MTVTRRTALSLLAAATAVPRCAFADILPTADTPNPPGSGLPTNPRVIDLPGVGRRIGRQGGTIRMIIGGQRDIRYVPINSYARLVGYDANLAMQPDILASFTAEENRVYTFTLREGHRWSDGAPFTAEDFRYVWDDVLNDDTLTKGGLPVDLRANGQPATFEVLNPLTVRYTFPAPAPDFLPKLASPVPLVLALPAHYLRQFHAGHTPEEALIPVMEAQRVDDWKGLHQKMSRQPRPENPDLPTLEAWRPRTTPPAEQFVFERNPHFHRVDTAGTQLPYVDRVVLNVASGEIITAQTSTGESDLQFTGITFSDYTLLKQAETVHPIKVSLWTRTQGSSVALLPNLTCNDPVWRALFHDVRVRRALSIAINRAEINKVIFYGLGRESADTVLPESPLFRPEYARAWAQFDPDQANALLDQAGLTTRDIDGTRRLPDGRKAGIVVESSGESTLETDVLELITDHFRDVGIPLYIRTSQRDIFRSRALAGDVTMSVWQGLDNGVPTAEMSPKGLAPSQEDQLNWPMWGLHYMTSAESGTAPDLAPAADLVAALEAWRASTDSAAREAIWHRMLAIRADQVFSIGTVNAALQPVVRHARLMNVPEKGLYGFEPTAYMGAYLPDTFWYEEEA